MPAKEFFLRDVQPSWDLFITPESWLVFEIMEHSTSQVKGMLYPPFGEEALASLLHL